MVTDSIGREDRVNVGDYIVIQRNNYYKLHQLSDGNVVLGKDKVALKPVVGEPFWTTFKMLPKPGHRREYKLEMCDRAESFTESLMREVTSGRDNRDITDDGNSQSLTTEQIIELRDSGLSPQDILGKLIENSKTFKNKTEYSQEKYVKKKEKKYYEYLTIRKPTLRLIAEIFYNRDQCKVLGLRYDTLAQIMTAMNVQSGGTYVLFENGTQALVAAALLNCLTAGATLVNITIGNQAQKQAVLAMNFDAQKLDNFLSVKALNLVQSLYPENGSADGDKTDDASGSTDLQNTDKSCMINSDKLECTPEPLEMDGPCPNDVEKMDSCRLSDAEETEGGAGDVADNNNSEDAEEIKMSDVAEHQRKRKASSPEVALNKKPRWAEDLERVCNLLRSEKADGLVIAAKEFPLNLIAKLIPFIKASRPLVVYSLYREPLVQLYVELKKRKDIIGMHLTETWLRSYQVLPDRTHPNVTMSAGGGHILTATVVQP